MQKKILKNNVKEWLITFGFLAVATVTGYILTSLQDNHLNVAMIYMLAVVFTARFTSGFIYGTVSSFISVFCINYLFAYPYFAFNFTKKGYPLMFLSMLGISLITNAMTLEIKKQAKIAQENEKQATELFEITKELQKEQEEIKIEAAKEKLRTDLFRAVSHDLRTPLTTILGASSAILENKEILSKEEQHKLLSDIHEDAEWLIRMVENLLSVTRISEGIAKLNKNDEVVEEIVAESLSKIKKHYPDASVKVKVPDELLIASMDATLIEQVIINLIENAIQHSGSADISFNVFSKNNEILFEVKDKGKGISENDLPHLFKEYYTTSEEKSDSTKNMGIGLSVCMSIVKAHGGTLTAQNAPEGGAVFQFTLKGK